MRVDIANAAEGDPTDEFADLPEEVDDETFPDLALAPDICEHAVAAWNAFLGRYPSRQTAGEAIFAAIFDASPSLQVSFKSPSTVLAMKFVNGFGAVVLNAGDPSRLKPLVETLGFQHMDFDVTRQKIQTFRDAITDLFDMDLGKTLTSKGKYGIAVLLNYVGGACMYIRREYAVRVRAIHATWALATHTREAPEESGHEEEEAGEADAGEGNEDKTENPQGPNVGNLQGNVPSGFFDP